MGWINIFHCEWNPFGQKILKHYWPDAISYGDITTTDFNVHRGQIDVLSGGFPCQTFSLAGKGSMDLSIWKQMLRSINEIEPGWVVIENVYGLVSRKSGMAFDEVQADLEDQGYETASYLLPACGVQAPHQRFRIFIVANSAKFRNGRLSVQQRTEREESFNSYGMVEEEFNTYNKKQRLEKRNGESAQFGSYSTNHRFSSVPHWENFPVKSPVWVRNDGVSIGLDTKAISETSWRKQSIEGAGNAVVPQVVYEIFKAIDQVA